MPTRSNAYTSFRLALGAADALLRHERTLADPPHAAQQDLAVGLRSGALVLMVGAFESFLRDAFEERLDELGTRVPAAKFDLLPGRLRTTAVFTLLDESMRGAPGKPVADERVDRIPDIRKAAASVATGQVLGKAFSTTGSNPSAATVKEMFKRVDCTPVFERVHPRLQRLWGQPLAKKYAEQQLDFIVNARHEVAHGASPLTWSRGDLRSAERLVRLLAQALDDELRVHLNQVRRV